LNALVEWQGEGASVTTNDDRHQALFVGYSHGALQIFTRNHGIINYNALMDAAIPNRIETSEEESSKMELRALDAFVIAAEQAAILLALAFSPALVCNTLPILAQIVDIRN
jgi:hypothetical protein